MKSSFCANDQCRLHDHLVEDHVGSVRLATNDLFTEEVTRHVYAARSGRLVFLCGRCHRAVEIIAKT